MKNTNPFKVGLAAMGFFGAGFYDTFDPITIISYILYIFMASLMLPLIWDFL